MSTELRPNFWKQYPLEQLNSAEWEALCDGCGLCCLVKLEDDETAEVAYTKVACKLLDCKTARCSDYVNRQQQVADCIQLIVFFYRHDGFASIRNNFVEN